MQAVETQPVPQVAKPVKKPTAKRDKLTAIEAEIRKEWKEAHLYESNAQDGTPHYFVTFPYPYMNGLLHLGHTFTLSKAEFAVRYQKLKGRNVVFPFGFHCTGMPIMACANKLKEELTTYGFPPVFPKEETAPAPAPAPAPASVPDKKPEAAPKAQKGASNKTDPSQFHSKRGKVAQKGGNKRQWDILISNGIPPEEIPQFQDPMKWLRYFPPIGMTDLEDMGVAVDWRRSFITTDVNPYYDSFVRWQFMKLKAMGLIEFGKRNTIFSPHDNQPCADHDRSSGEGVLPQEYVAIKLQVVEPLPAVLKPFADRKIFLVAGTLRPETMYGQTNCWILPTGDYGAFAVGNNEAFICTERAAKNFAYQEIAETPGKITCLAKFKGSDIIGAPLKAPLAPYNIVYTLPMTTIHPDKGTGVVTSVPSDSPDDYMNFMQLKSKPEYRKKLGVLDEWVAPFDVVPIIDVPELGNNAAEFVCKDLKIKSPLDADLLEKAKGITYLKGFYTGKMIVGPHTGKLVQDAKPLVRAMLLETKQAVLYSEPASKVMSRAGDECVVSMCDQWYLNYGDPEWKKKTIEVMKSMELYHPGSAEIMSRTIDIFNQWGCSRSFGLGTRLPWDPQYLIESLSDSTIYMAYYTVAHLLQGGVLDGSKTGPLGITANQMTPAIWEYILCDGPFPADTTIPRETVDKLKKEFTYWYPFDLRVSGKDLLSNHLVFCLFNHAAIFPKKGPHAFRANGHLLINNEKMSKSTGNFLSLRDAVNLYTADGMRIALADAGDGIDDANFLETTADTSLLKLHTQLAWIEEVLADESKLSPEPSNNFHDFVFESMINKAVIEADDAYQRLMFREAHLHALHDLQAARDLYRTASEELGIPMKKHLIHRFLEVQALVMSPITPHFSDYVWRKLLKKPDFIWHARWPEVGAVDKLILQQSTHLETTAADFRVTIRDFCQPKKKKVAAIPAPQSGEIVVATAFPQWHIRLIEILNGLYNEEKKSLPENTKIAPLIAADPMLAKSAKKIMASVAFMQESVSLRGREALQIHLPFDEAALFKEHLTYMSKILKLPNLTIRVTDQADENAKLVPGKPALVLPKP